MWTYIMGRCFVDVFQNYARLLSEIWFLFLLYLTKFSHVDNKLKKKWVKPNLTINASKITNEKECENEDYEKEKVLILIKKI